jgi:hypothetical protein
VIAGVELAQRTGGGVARVGEERLARCLLPRVDGGEIRVREINLAAHLQHLGDVPAGQRVGDVLYGQGIGGDVLADLAVAARRRGHEPAGLVAQRQRQAVDLRLGGEGDRLVGRQVEEATHPGDEFLHVLVGEGVAQREHRHRVPDLGELFRRLGADARARLGRAGQCWKAGLDRLQLLAQGVVFGIGELGRVLVVVEVVRPLDRPGQFRMARLGGVLAQGFDDGGEGRARHGPRSSRSRATVR